MPFVKLDDQIAHHPKVLQAGAEAAWLWACAIAYCNRQLTDGFVPAQALATFGVFRTPARKLAERLVAVGLFDAAADGFRVHDYLVHNPDRATVQQRMRDAADRQAKSRGARNGAVTGVSQRDSGVTGASSRAYVPTPTPTPTPDKPPPPPKGVAYTADFERFWQAYPNGFDKDNPRKGSKADAFKAWRKIAPDDALLAEMLTALTWQRETVNWAKEGGAYIPNVSTWLNGRRWEIERPTDAEQGDADAPLAPYNPVLRETDW